MPQPELKYMGVTSCASNSCHNRDAVATFGVNPAKDAARPIKYSEYSIWASHDKHARAYAILFDDRSRVILRNYRQLKVDIKDVHPEADKECLACHCTNAAAHRQGPLYTKADGIGCESCHGPSEKWLDRHYMDGWKKLSPSQKADLGFLDTKDLLIRGKQCVECHVGMKDAEVNHDLIAAGHPRLNFEYSAFLANMPHHWTYADELARHPDLQARVWAIGQALSAHTALDQLSRRAEAKDKPWPEFVEYDCYACHHDLKSDSWRQKRGYGKRLPGSLSWNSWYTTMLDKGMALDGSAGELPGLLESIRKEMQKPLPSRETTAQQAHQAADLLDRRLNALNQGTFTPEAVQQGLRSLGKADPKAIESSWDAGAQYYLGLAAFYNALTDYDRRKSSSELKAEFKALVDDLRFPSAKGKVYDSPARTDPRRWTPVLEKLQKQLGD